MHRINTWLFPPHFSHLLDSIVNSKLKIAPLEFFNVLIFWNKSYSQAAPFGHIYEEICYYYCYYYCLETNLPDRKVIIKACTNCKTKMQSELVPKWITVVLPLQRGGMAGCSSWALSEIPPYTDKVDLKPQVQWEFCFSLEQNQALCPRGNNGVNSAGAPERWALTPLHGALSAVTKAFPYSPSNIGVRTYLHESLH